MLQRRLEDLGEEAGEDDIETRILKSWMKEQGAEETVNRSGVFDEWNKFEKQRKRGIPTDKKGRLNSSLKLKQSRHKNLCSQWFFGRFPRNP